MLVVATPCPLLIAIPVAIIGSMSLAARRGIIIKDPAVLERIDACRTAIFDKTGTLTYGRPHLTECSRPRARKARGAGLVASLERYSKHPLAGAILEAAEKQGIELRQAAEISEPPGEGLTGDRVRPIRAGHEPEEVPRGAPRKWQANCLPPPAGMECVVLIDGRYAAALRFRDEPRRTGPRSSGTWAAVTGSTA